MQEHEHNNAAAESTPQPPEMPAGANIPREASDSHDGHESPTPPPEQEDAADAGAVPVTTIRPPATAERLPQEQEAALLRRYGGVLLGLSFSSTSLLPSTKLLLPKLAVKPLSKAA